MRISRQEYDIEQGFFQEDIIPTFEKMLVHIDLMAGQIANLKAALIKERAAQGTGIMFWNQAPTSFKELYTQKATAQLAQEFPDIVQEERE